jgi:DNA-binding GntR family transcriptional regulator
MIKSIKLPKYRTKEEYAYDNLRTAILHCELKPGEKVVIDSLSEKLAVSPIPVRSALQRLQSEGLVEIIPHTGAVITEISPDQISEVFLLLEVLESAAFKVAAGKASQADIEQLQQMIRAMEEAFAAGDSERWSELNGQFHRFVSGITNMKLIMEFTGRVLDRWDRLRRWYLGRIVSKRIPAAMEDHRKMVELLARREVETLSHLAAFHNHQARADYEKLLREEIGS